MPGSNDIADKDGKIITEDFRTMLDSAAIVSDNRLAPGEKRTVSFDFFSTSRDVSYQARLVYVYEPYIITQERMSVEIDDIKGKLQ